VFLQIFTTPIFGGGVGFLGGGAGVGPVLKTLGPLLASALAAAATAAGMIGSAATHRWSCGSHCGQEIVPATIASRSVMMAWRRCRQAGHSRTASQVQVVVVTQPTSVIL
jgi:hypothetical protein